MILKFLQLLILKGIGVKMGSKKIKLRNSIIGVDQGLIRLFENAITYMKSLWRSGVDVGNYPAKRVRYYVAAIDDDMGKYVSYEDHGILIDEVFDHKHISLVDDACISRKSRLDNDLNLKSEKIVILLRCDGALVAIKYFIDIPAFDEVLGGNYMATVYDAEYKEYGSLFDLYNDGFDVEMINIIIKSLLFQIGGSIDCMDYCDSGLYGFAELPYYFCV